MLLTLSNIKHSPSLSEETNAFTASLYADGVKAADVSNRGNGGSHSYHWHCDFETRAQVEAYAKAQSLAYDFERLDQIVDALFSRALVEKQMRRWMKKQTCFRLVGDKPHSWRTLNSVAPNAPDRIRSQYGDRLALILSPETLSVAVDSEIATA